VRSGKSKSPVGFIVQQDDDAGNDYLGQQIRNSSSFVERPEYAGINGHRNNAHRAISGKPFCMRSAIVERPVVLQQVVQDRTDNKTDSGRQRSVDRPEFNQKREYAQMQQSRQGPRNDITRERMFQRQ